jgi:glucose-1-phosphate thymidylyltransferase
MKGVLICGGTGSRLLPLTQVSHKSLLPVYNQPLINYPLSTLINAGITDIMVVTGPDLAGAFMQYLGSGAKFNCKFTYRIQDEPGGIAQALGMAEDFANGDNVCALLGDNIYLDDITKQIADFSSGGHIFTTLVEDPERFGVVEVQDGVPMSIEEKPANPKSNLAQTGCYIYDSRCFDVIKTLTPSGRNELEITDVTKWYLEQKALMVSVLTQPWIDAGTFESLQEATTVIAEHYATNGIQSMFKDPAINNAILQAARKHIGAL